MDAGINAWAAPGPARRTDRTQPRGAPSGVLFGLMGDVPLG